MPGIRIWNTETKTALQINPTAVPPIKPKIAPSTVFFGLTLGQSLCLPNARPPKYAAPSPPYAIANAIVIRATPGTPPYVLFIIIMNMDIGRKHVKSG